MTDYSKLKDLELASLLRERDHNAFTEIYNRHWQALFIYANSMLKDADEAADVVQDIFTTLWNRSAEIQIDTALKAYLYISTRNQALKVINKTSKGDAYAEELFQTFEEGISTTDEEMNFRELCTILDKAIDHLPPRMIAVYIKSKEDGLSHRTIPSD